MFSNPFSFNGRIGRLEYFLTHLVCLCYNMIILFILFSLAGKSGVPTFIQDICCIPSIWFGLAQGAKRCHDLGHSGFFMLIPFYGLWMFFAAGDNEENEYGPALD